MSVPSNDVYENGSGQVSDDNLNTFVQTCDTVSNLRAFIGTEGMEIDLQGFTSPGDGGQGPFYWNAAGTGPDDGGVTNVVPSGAAVGCWTRIGSVAGQNSIIQCTATGTNTIALSARSGQTVVTSYSDTQLFGFVASATTSGSVTANVNSVGPLPVYRTDLTQAASGDLVSGVYYIIAYNSALNTGSGGFQLTSNTLDDLIFTGGITAPSLAVTGSTAPANGMYLPSANKVGISARSLLIATFTNPAGGVNYFAFDGAGTTGRPAISVTGSDTNVSMSFGAKGTGGYFFYGNTGATLLYQLPCPASSVNGFEFTPSATGNPVSLGANGSDTNVGFNLITQGTGDLLFKTNNVQTFAISGASMAYVGTAALATGATAGFLWITSSAGAATGAATAPYTNAAAIHYDSTNNRIMIRCGGTWRSTAALT